MKKRADLQEVAGYHLRKLMMR